MTTDDLPLVGAAIQTGWEKLTSNFWLCVGVVLCSMIIPIVVPTVLLKAAGAAMNADLAGNAFWSPLAGLAGKVMNIVVEMGLLKVALSLNDRGEAEFKQLFSCLPLFLNYLAASILYGLIVLVGVLLLIVPGIIWSIQFQFYNYAIVDEGLGPIAALERSSQITKGAKWQVLGLNIMVFLISLAGVLCFVVGIIPAEAVAVIAVANVYRRLSAKRQVGGLTA